MNKNNNFKLIKNIGGAEILKGVTSLIKLKTCTIKEENKYEK